MKQLAKAISIASVAFEDRLDKGNNPYILHCLYVMDKVKHLGEKAMICAVLHDLFEDTDWNSADLINHGFDTDIIETLLLLTHKEDESYTNYIKKISTNKLATKIKKADLIHNSQITRLKGLTKKDFDRLEKYFTAYEYLKKV